MSRPEDSRVKIPALVHLTRLGYTYLSIKDQIRGTDYDGDTKAVNSTSCVYRKNGTYTNHHRINYFYECERPTMGAK